MISLDDILLIVCEVEWIIVLICDYQVVVIVGEIGLGKIIQLLKLCLVVGWGVVGMIGCIQL